MEITTMKKFLLLFTMSLLIVGLMATAVPRVPQRYTGPQNPTWTPTREVFYTENFESGATGWTHYDGAVVPNNWHVSTYGAPQGDVWWMGDEGGNGGYYDHEYLVLDTPVIAIATGSSTLTFKMRHGLEAPGTSGDYDGWDSFNIRVSTNSGVTYTVIPTAVVTPAYDFANSYAFGSEFGEGLGIPGWGGHRDTWTAVTADLSGFLTGGAANVKIRFAFAADPAQSTGDDPSLYGVMVDDIALASYSNNGVLDAMTFASLVPTAGDFWHLATDASAPSPTHIMSSMNGSGTYVPFMLNYLVSPEITLPADATQIVADFQLKGSYADGGVFPDVDYFGWEIFHDGSWYYMSNPYADTTLSNYVFSGGPDIWASMVNSYAGVDGDISLLAGQTVKFAWYFQSNANTPIGTPLQIDNFQIFSVTDAPAPPNLVYPLNGQTGLPYTGFDLDWSASSLGATPESYNLYMDQTEANLEIATFAPAYTEEEILISYYNPVDSLLTLSAGQTWYWRVGAYVAGQEEALSSIFRFDIVAASLVITTFPWNEGFEGGVVPPTGWTRTNVDNDVPNTSYTPDTGKTWIVNTTAAYCHSGTKSAVHPYSTAVADPGQNGWLVTPPVEIPATGVAAISFWNYNRYGGEVYNGLMINTDPSPTDPYWVELWTQDEIAGHWSQETVNLQAYAGNVVYFAFKYTGYDANNWYVDDVNVSVYTGDVLAPILSGHLPVLNTPREDLTWPVTVNVVDDAVFNNPITAVNLYWSLNGGSTWSAAIPMTLTTGTTYAGTLPAQALGSTVTYKFEAFDNVPNMASATYSYQVFDPTWIWYDTGGTGYTGFPTYNWGPAVWYENPFYGTDTAVKLLSVDGSLYNNTAGNGPTTATLHIYGEDFEGNLTDLMTPITVTFNHTAYHTFDLSAYNIQISSPWFWISYENLGTNRYFLYDATYDYTSPLFLMIGGDLYTSTSPGEWCIGAQVQTGELALYEAPVVTIALNGSGQPVVTWAGVDGALSYDVYGCNDPYALFPDDWTVLANNTIGTSYTYTGPDPMQFFKVVASPFVGGGRNMTLQPAMATKAPKITDLPKGIKMEFNPIKH
jgi:hypothetical protein